MPIDETTKWLIGLFLGGMAVLIGWVRSSGQDQIAEIKEALKEIRDEFGEEIKAIQSKLDKDQSDQQKMRHEHRNLITENYNRINELGIKFTEFRASVKTSLSQFHMMLKEGLRLISGTTKNDSDS